MFCLLNPGLKTLSNCFYATARTAAMNYSIPLDKIESRKKIGLSINGQYVLFASAFDIPGKGSELAQESVNKLKDVILLELKGYNEAIIIKPPNLLNN